MGSLSIGQVVLATFPFSDLSSTKLRPCLIIGLADFDEVLLCQITSKPYGSNKVVSLSASDFTQGSIAVDSYIRPGKIATLDRKRLKKVLGTIDVAKLNEVKQRLRVILEVGS